MIEKELKYQLTFGDFEKFKEYVYQSASIKENFNQTNFYIETNQYHLSENDISLRIRKKDNQTFEFTIKLKNIALENNLSIKKEFNKLIDHDLANDILQNKVSISETEIGQWLNQYLNVKNSSIEYSIIGNLKTFREVCKITDFLDPIILDKSSYLSIEDYEVEWETEDITQARYWIENSFDVLQIQPIDNMDSKRKRFLKRLTQLKALNSK